ncbi:thioredoxin domain-containing protein [Metallosphaera tengchongensis]|uniref:Thioredoxin domain-containing protein n=2 Tax=Metallosphaera tengchongensis TaxID=1532350 RepID=A0A6N0P117_9CREN|nr:thioredoxin domain-containing protein [Metallosphaera tengchongensis]QKR01091.1 thioredoxin domain-containing protein [Metallosphaera tengchongensis]
MNRLANSQSSFLRESADQPVDWFPWSDDAFQKAKQEDKPILVDVGAVWCHWCHVMDRETYSNKEVAELINNNFIAVKVDRDEMPELDRKLQRAVASITGESGWPLTVFMTPSGEVFFGGTYFPPEDSYGRVGMKRLLREVARLWREDRERLRKSALSLIDYSPNTQVPISFDIVDVTISSVVSSFDMEYGGLGNSMKFPHPLVDQLLTAYSFWTGDEVTSRLAVFTLKKMYQGGVFDQLGGGFHRYAVDREWNVPHFEKLLIDNAELLEDYVNVYLYSKDPQLLDVIKLTSQFLFRDMWTGEGFATSIDADVGEKEGGYYVWEWEELLSASNEYRELVKRAFTLVGEGALEGGVLRMREDPDDLSKELGKTTPEVLEELGKVREKLREYRDRTRKKPFVDRNLYTYPNCRVADAIMTSSLITGYGREISLKVVDRLGRKVSRRLDGGSEGLLEDYASATLLALRAYQITGEMKYRNLAVDLGVELESFATGSGFSDRRGSNEVPTMDTPNESPNSLAVRALLSLSVINEQFNLKEDVMGKILGDYVQGPSFYAGLTLSLGSMIKGIAHVVVIDSGDELAKSLHRYSLLTYHPFKIVEIVKEDDRDLVIPLVRSMIDQGSGSRAFVCVGNTCSLPVREQEKIKLLLKSKANLH